MAKIITVTSGKGGVGKTSISLNLSLSLAAQGCRVCLFDADLGLANISILTGIYPKKNLESVISGLSSLDDIIIKNFQGVDIIPGSSGVEKLADLTRTQTGTLISAFLGLKEYDYFIFDTSAGISSQVLSFCMASHEIILVATPEPTSLTDAYSLLKVLSKHGYDQPVKVVINRVTKGKEAQNAYSHLRETVNRFLKIKLEPLGIVATDKNVLKAVVSQTPFFMLFPDTIATKCINSIAAKLLQHMGRTGNIPLELFWDQCLTFLDKQKALKPVDVPEKEGKKEDKKETKEEHPKTIQAISQLAKRLSILTKEVEGIKQFLKTRDITPQSHNNPADAPQKPLPPPEPKEIPLDFESWHGKKST